jgi:carbonic anhydrase
LLEKERNTDMGKSLEELKKGYIRFKQKYASGDVNSMQLLAENGQEPQVMIVACADSRVEPASLCQCGPGDLFVVRNVANIVPPYSESHERDSSSAALEFGICYLEVKHLIILGHSQCAGIGALFDDSNLHQNDFISRWVSTIKFDARAIQDAAALEHEALHCSYQNCLTFPWLKERVDAGTLQLHLWHFDIKEGELFTYSFDKSQFEPLV